MITIEVTSINKKISSLITDISPIADPKTGNFTIKAEVDNSGNDIKPGMFVKCLIKRRTDQDFAVIPSTTLMQKNGDSAVVFTVHNGYLVKKNLKILNQKEGKVWVEALLEIGEKIVDKPSPFLKEGEYVETD